MSGKDGPALYPAKEGGGRQRGDVFAEEIGAWGVTLRRKLHFFSFWKTRWGEEGLHKNTISPPATPHLPRYLPKGEQVSKRKRAEPVYWRLMGWRTSALPATKPNRHIALIYSRIVSSRLAPWPWHLFKCQRGCLSPLCHRHTASLPYLHLLPSPPQFYFVFSTAWWVHRQNNVRKIA